MALTIETGAGVAGADSYITAAQADTIDVNLFGAAGTETTAHKEAALRRAWYYLKSLSWRDEFPAFDGVIPEDVKTAQAILARFERASPNGLAPNVVPGQQKVLVRAGEIGWQATGQSGVDAQRAVVAMAADLLKPYVMAGSKFLMRG